eukprot:Hpha_TRINITY_DN2213_c0_g1::TRINITY_DN2213_c0_g1_i1::g.25423::m.25423
MPRPPRPPAAANAVAQITGTPPPPTVTFGPAGGGAVGRSSRPRPLPPLSDSLSESLSLEDRRRVLGATAGTAVRGSHAKVPSRNLTFTVPPRSSVGIHSRPHSSAVAPSQGPRSGTSRHILRNADGEVTTWACVALPGHSCTAAGASEVGGASTSPAVQRATRTGWAGGAMSSASRASASLSTFTPSTRKMQSPTLTPARWAGPPAVTEATRVPSSLIPTSPSSPLSTRTSLSPSASSPEGTTGASSLSSSEGTSGASSLWLSPHGPSPAGGAGGRAWWSAACRARESSSSCLLGVVSSVTGDSSERLSSPRTHGLNKTWVRSHILVPLPSCCRTAFELAHPRPPFLHPGSTFINLPLTFLHLPPLLFPLFPLSPQRCTSRTSLIPPELFISRQRRNLLRRRLHHTPHFVVVDNH